ncbi:hypothetical protein KR084_002799 [Drosophila pseudotakahashii]|nr:hypothetical protein KR084_002799 [Drosophila pseudotakahashii]
MKALARSYVWWPNIDADIELTVKRCQAFQETRNEPHKSEVHFWESTKEPWCRLHVDFAGPFQGKVFFLVVDSFSKWLEVSVVKSTTAACAIAFLRQLFATHGIPDELVSDNGTAFTSDEFRKFMSKNIIRHIRSAPFYPATNGQAERMVQSTKGFLKKMERDTDINLALARYLFSQHCTPHSTTGHSPAELLLKRELKSFLDKIQPSEIILGKDSEPANKKTFVTGSPVWVRNYSSGRKWIEGRVSEQTGPISYTVDLDDSRVVRRHLDQLQAREPTTPSTSTGDSFPVPQLLSPSMGHVVHR